MMSEMGESNNRTVVRLPNPEWKRDKKKAQLLRDKSLATKFQVLIVIATGQPNIQQKDIARKLNVSPQAISQYIQGLVKDRFVASDGRSKYRVTRVGINWVLRMFRDLQSYSNFVRTIVTDTTVCAAVADCNLSQGQEVGLEMKDGLLFATNAVGRGAKGIVASDAKKGEDVGISDLEGIVPLEMGKITILKMPSIQRGGSRSVDLTLLKDEIDKSGLVGAIGTEALIALRGVGTEPYCFYGVKEAVVEAAMRGLPFLVVCTGDEIPDLLRRLDEENLDYELRDLKKNRKS